MMKVCDVPEVDYFAEEDEGKVFDLINILRNFMQKYVVTSKSC